MENSCMTTEEVEVARIQSRHLMEEIGRSAIKQQAEEQAKEKGTAVVQIDPIATPMGPLPRSQQLKS